MTIRRFGTHSLLICSWLGAGSCVQVTSQVTTDNTGAAGAENDAALCAEGTDFCNGACVDITSSATDCGGCGIACGTGMTCQAGQCACGGGLTLCGPACANLLTDGANCGACGNVCVDQTCSRGQCSTSCEEGTQCGNSCVDHMSDVFNCGGCGIVCPAGQTCAAGFCTCDLGLDLCGDSCVDLATSPGHCGACGNDCGGYPCENGVCQVPETGGSGGDTTGGSSGEATGGASEGGTGAGTTGGTGGGPTGGGTGGGTGGSTTGGRTGGGTGGIVTGGAGGATGGTAGGGSYTVAAGAFVTSCSWSGFAWTTADSLSSIDPTSFSGLAAGADLCASGTVTANPDYGYAMLGVNIGQENTGATDPPNAEVAPQGNGLYVRVTNSASNALRIQIQDEAGKTDASHRWCANYTAPGLIAWTNFNTACWDNSGSAYAKQPINAVLVAVPGDPQNNTPFNFCINELTPQGDPACSAAGN